MASSSDRPQAVDVPSVRPVAPDEIGVGPASVPPPLSAPLSAPFPPSHKEGLGVAPVARHRAGAEPGLRTPAATIAGLRARIAAARTRGDAAVEAAASAALVRHLVAHEQNLEEATLVGRRALALEPNDLGLRTLLTTTLEALGEHGLAAATLRPVVDAACADARKDEASLEAAVSGLVRLGDLHLRSGDVEGALESYRYVSVLAQERPIGQERVALVHASAPDAVPAEIAARAFLGAAKKHQLAGDEGRALEALTRAFEVDPRSPLPAAVLADALEELGRLDAADAVRAEHAAAQTEREAAAVVHVARVEKAAIAGDRATRLSAEVDLLVDVVRHEPERARADALRGLPFEALLGLTRAIRRGHALGELGATHLSALADECTGAERVELLTEIVARDPADERALAALREHARLRRDPATVVDALVRGLRGAGLDAALVAARAAELAGWADEQLDDVQVAAWAWRKLLERIPDDRRARDELGRLQPRVAKASQRQEEARARAASDDPVVRATALTTLAEALLSRPDRAADAVDVLVSALRADPGRAAPLVARAVRCLLPAEAEAVVVAAAATAELRTTAAPLRVELLLRRGDLRGAATAAQALDEPTVQELALAVLVGGLPELGHALERFAPTVASPRERAALLAGAARSFRSARAGADARRLAEAALRLDPRDARGAIELAELAAGEAAAVVGPALAAAALERALGVVGARGRWSLALAALAEREDDFTLAAAWTRRAWVLRPADPEVATVWLRRAAALGDPELCAEVVDTVARGVARLGAIAPPLADVLDALRSAGPEAAPLHEATARLLLALGGARHPALYAALVPTDPARSESPPGPASHSLAIAALERWLASAAPASERGPTLRAIARVATAAAEPSRAVGAWARLLTDPDASPELRAEAEAALMAAADRSDALDPDAEIVVRSLSAERALRAAVARLAEASRPRAAPEVEPLVVHAADELRLLGRDLWDLADDADAARRVWLRGARLLGAEGLDRLEADLRQFGGEAQARDAVYELARSVVLPEDDVFVPSVRLTVLAQQLRARAFERAVVHPPEWVEPLSLAREAVTHAPDPAAVLPGVELLVRRIQRVDALPELYELAAGRSAGRFAERGVRHHAARVLERLGLPLDALHHAVRAFAAQPTEGSALRSLERLAIATRRQDLATAALIEAAEQSAEAERKATFFDRAVSLGREAPAEERLDLLLRLFLIAPSPRTVDGIAEAIRAVAGADEQLRDTEVERLLRAHRKVDGKLGYGDRLPVLSAVARAVAELRGVGPALELVARGAKSTPRGDLAPLREVAEQVGRLDPEAARAWLSRTSEADGGVLRAHVAWAFGDADLALQLLVAHAPDDDDLDFAGESGAANDVALVESWSSTARDHRVVAQAWERFGKRQGAAAELETARALDAAGQAEEAAAALLRAFQLREGEPCELVEQIVELARAILPQAGQEAALATLLAEDVQRLGDDHPEVATRWREIAAVRARIADFVGVLDALFEAGRCAPADEDLWQEIADAAEAVGAHDRLSAALAQRLSRARPDRRVQLLRKLARVLEHDLGRDAEAAERWGELVRLLPLDSEAGDALERIAERRGGGAELVDLLRARAARLPAGHPDRVRVLRRLSRELAGHPVRRGEVLAALREVHQHSPGDVDVAVQLATLARAAGDVGTAAEALLRAFRASEPGGARIWLAIEAARVLLELHDLETAARLLHEAASEPDVEKDARILDLVRLQLEVAVARADGREEAAARIRLADLDHDAPPRTRAAHALSAARVLREGGDLAGARKLAWSAARLVPGDAPAAAFLCELELGQTTAAPRATAPSDAELLTLVSAIDVGASVPADVLAVIACARADLLDALRGAGTGYQDLHTWPESVRAQPLVQLALAERLSAEWSYAAAAVAYERAFAGDLRGLRPLGPTALRAADAAARSNDPTRARAFLDLAARDPDCRIDARRRAVDLARAARDGEGARRALERLAAEASGNVRAQALAEQAELVRDHDPDAALEIMRLAVAAADGPLREKLASDLRTLETPADPHAEARALPPAPPPSLRDSGVRSLPLEQALASTVADGAPAEPVAIAPAVLVSPPSPPAVAAPTSDPTLDGVGGSEAFSPLGESTPPPEPSAPSEAPKPPEKETTQPGVGEPGPAAAAPEVAPRAFRATMPALPAVSAPVAGAASIDRAAASRVALDGSARVQDRIRAFAVLAGAAQADGNLEQAIRDHLSALELGDVDAGDRAADLLSALPDRAGDVLLVRRRQAFLEPGVHRHLDHLHEAALGVRDHILARAIDHVRRAFDPVAGPVPPPPLDLQLDRPELLLPLLERRAVPTAAEALRIAWEQGASALKRDPGLSYARGMDRVTGTIPLGRVVAAATRLLGVRTPIFVRQRAGLDVDVVLVPPPYVVLGGDAREDTPDVRYILGAGLMAALPSHALMLAQPEREARATYQALLSAFGPPEHGRNISAEVGRLAAALWQSVPRAAQRRLGELLGTNPPPFEAVLDGARQVARRGGLYLSGDIGATLRRTLSETQDPAVLEAEGGLAEACREHPAVADLVRLATSPELAEARWRMPAAAPRRTPSGGQRRP